jgi:hypothetical protein
MKTLMGHIKNSILLRNLIILQDACWITKSPSCRNKYTFYAGKLRRICSVQKLQLLEKELQN